MLAAMTTKHLMAGRRTQILRTVFDSRPRRIRFKAECEDGSPAGTVEVQGSRWIFVTPPVTQPLEAENVCTKRFWDSLYAIYVTPETDTTITFDTGPEPLNQQLTAIAALAIVLAIILIALSVLG